MGIVKSLSLVMGVLLIGCVTPVRPDRPAETYKGPIAERPMLQRGDYWIYELANGSRIKTDKLPLDLGFPLWTGKIWEYDSEAMPRGRSDPKLTHLRTPTRVTCEVTDYQQVAVRAGTFATFKCECQCRTLSVAYEPECGEWTIWYALEARNIVKTSDGSPTGTLELIQYSKRFSRQ